MTPENDGADSTERRNTNLFWRLRCASDEGRPAGGVQAEKQQRYVRLIAHGLNNSEACRLVGINRKTGNRWRYGRAVLNTAGEVVHYPPVKLFEPKPRSPRYLSEPERIMIADRLIRGESIRAIARELGRAPRRSVARSLATATLTGATGPIMPSTPPRPVRVGRGRGGSPRMACWPGSSPGCWGSAGARSKSRTSCGSCSPVSDSDGCVWSRSIRRSMTRPSSSPVPLADAAVAAGFAGSSGADG